MGQPYIPPTPAGTSLVSKTVLITGGNIGTGSETARQCLTLQASWVIITVRSESKGEQAVSALRADAAINAVNPSATIEAFIIDLDDYGSGLRFVKKVKQEVSELDTVLCNGGINIMDYRVSKSCHEKVAQGKSQTILPNVLYWRISR